MSVCVCARTHKEQKKRASEKMSMIRLSDLPPQPKKRTKKADQFYSLQFPTGEVIRFNSRLTNYFEGFRDEMRRVNEVVRKEKKVKSVDDSPILYTFRSHPLMSYETYGKLWRLVFRMYSEHEAHFGVKKSPKMLMHSETMDMVFKTASMRELYNLLYLMVENNGVLLLTELKRELVRRLLPMRKEQLYALHGLTEEINGEEEAYVRESVNPIHQINTPYYKKLVTFWRAMKSEFLGDECIDSMVNYVPHTKAVVACGSGHSMFITPNGLFAHGSNDHGQLGIDPETLRYADRAVKVPLSDLYEVIAVKCGATHTLILTTNGLYACGSNEHGKLGIGSDYMDELTVGKPMRVPLESVTDFACGDTHSIFVTHGGRRLYGAGSNKYMQLGLGEEFSGEYNDNAYYAPIRIPFSEKIAIKSVACGDDFSLFLTPDGILYGCGAHESNQRGDTLTDYTTGLDVVKFREKTRIAEMACGAKHTVVLTTNGAVRTFGDDSEGQLGYVLPDSYEKASEDSGRKKKARIDRKTGMRIKTVSVSCGPYSTMILDEDGKVNASGTNHQWGQLGIGIRNRGEIVSSRRVGVAFDDYDEFNQQEIISVTPGAYTSFFLTKKDGLYATGKDLEWLLNEPGENYDPTRYHFTPIQIISQESITGNVFIDKQSTTTTTTTSDDGMDPDDESMEVEVRDETKRQ